MSRVEPPAKEEVKEEDDASVSELSASYLSVSTIVENITQKEKIELNSGKPSQSTLNKLWDNLSNNDDVYYYKLDKNVKRVKAGLYA